MPRLLTDLRELERGDVVLVRSVFQKKVEGGVKEIVWHWYGIHVHRGGIYSAKFYRLGSNREQPFRWVNPGMDEVSFLDPEEWPDGIIALRTSLILRGEIDID